MKNDLIMEWAIDQNLPKAEQSTLTALVWHKWSTPNSRVFPSIERLTWMTGLTERGQRDALRGLEARGIVDTCPNAGPHGTNEYFIPVPPGYKPKSNEQRRKDREERKARERRERDERKAKGGTSLHEGGHPTTLEGAPDALEGGTHCPRNRMNLNEPEHEAEGQSQPESQPFTRNLVSKRHDPHQSTALIREGWEPSRIPVPIPTLRKPIPTPPCSHLRALRRGKEVADMPVSSEDDWGGWGPEDAAALERARAALGPPRDECAKSSGSWRGLAINERSDVERMPA